MRAIDEGLTLETSAIKLFIVANLRFNSFDNTELLCCTLPPTQHHSSLETQPLYQILTCPVYYLKGTEWLERRSRSTGQVSLNFKKNFFVL